MNANQYAYMITRIGGRAMSRGTLVVADDDTGRLAADLLAENRVGHSYYSGPRRCSIWPHPADEPFPDAPPETAEHFDG